MSNIGLFSLFKLHCNLIRYIINEKMADNGAGTKKVKLSLDLSVQETGACSEDEGDLPL